MPSGHSPASSKVFLGAVLAILAIVVFFVAQNMRHSTDQPDESIGETEEAATAPSIAATDLIQEQLQNTGSKIVLLDIRPIDQYGSMHIVGSKSMPLESIVTSPLPSASDAVRFVIISNANEEQRAIQAVNIFLRKGFPNTLFLKGGIEEWVNQGGRVLSRGDIDSFADRSKIRLIKPEDLKSMLDKSEWVTVLDMRASDTFAQGHVPGAVNLPLTDLEERYDEIPTSKPIVVYGNSALEDFQAGVRLFDLNILGAKVLEGGFNAWKTKGFPSEIVAR